MAGNQLFVVELYQNGQTRTLSQKASQRTCFWSTTISPLGLQDPRSVSQKLPKSPLFSSLLFVVLGCAKEPLVGWTDNVLGITGIMVGTGIGIIRAIPVKGHYVTDLLPVDYAVNLILAATWDVANTQNDGNNLKIFNCVSGPNAPITWSKISEKKSKLSKYFFAIFQSNYRNIVCLWVVRMRQLVKLFGIHFVC